MKYTIFLNGSYPKDMSKYLDEIKNSIIYFVDGASNKVFDLDFLPDYIIGDLDSIDTKILNYYKSKNIEILKYPKDKDYTDFELALIHIYGLNIDLKKRFINKSVEIKGDKEILVFGACGGRLDMTLSNLKLLESNFNMKYISENEEEIFCIDRSIKIKNKKDKPFSILPLTNIEELTLKGFEYELDKTYISKYETLVSNKIVSDEALISFENAIILIII